LGIRGGLQRVVVDKYEVVLLIWWFLVVVVVGNIMLGIAFVFPPDRRRTLHIVIILV